MERVLTPVRHVSVVIPSAGTFDEFGSPLLWGALDLIGDQAEVIVVTTNGHLTEEAAHLCAAAGCRIIDVSSPDGFNFSRAINAGVRACRTPRILLLNDDVQGPAPAGWLRWWLAQAAPLSAVALRWPSNLVCYAGIKWGAPGRMPEHVGVGRAPEDLPLTVPTLAVTGAAMLVDRALFEAVGGFSESLPLNYNDIDFCLQALRLGVRPQQFNRIVLTHRESASRGHSPPTAKDYREFVRRGASVLASEGIELSAEEAIRAELAPRR